MTVIMDAKPAFEKIKNEIKSEVNSLKDKGIVPGLAAVVAGEDAISHTYVFFKQKDCQEVGINSEMVDLSKVNSNERESNAIRTIKELNERRNINGIIVQMPFPDFIDTEKIFDTLSPKKDVDCLTPFNLGKLLRGEYSYNDDLLPCTPRGVVELLKYYGIDVAGQDVAVIGRSVLVSNPLRKMLEDMDATATCYHTKSKNLLGKIKEADIIISAVGRPPEMHKDNSFRLTGEMVRNGAVIVGVGVRKYLKIDKLYFDVDVDSMKGIASFVTPNIGGVGLMTRAMLIKNTIIACKNLNGIK
ncbi:MAG: bifunctional 5,10-methylenetetrahydrofolate dehydrogenase/5,10-methenyltetrahydrofolate cyclohydrolase [Candidatus Aenigmarchaeota archaeon]|nr:bifunctional 5,10-methylenetetrahydrofolate dehydrogenase/5,10-methenyltetrahydrofolate cyclohydrolase [Candidatus Aenigmarchaeota archaeon]